ncbi:hypothetical protein AB2S62_21025 [Vibrio sp. NTOU-M3]|uniref:hypothetical protein n=1 Tax=Vibrio sp. NTOU-M3 TaxID=3234954 RepID=UPI00349F8C84
MKSNIQSLSDKQCDDLTVTSESVTATSKKTLYKFSLNALIIVAISILVNIAIRADYLYFQLSHGQISVTETIQLIMLAITAVTFVNIARTQKAVSHAALLIAGFFAVLMIREMDEWLDHIYHGFWVVPALITASAAIYYAYTGGQRTINEMAAILRAPFMNMLVGGVVLLLVFSRLYGMGSFWSGVMQDHYIRDVKNISEEGIELLCYCLIALSAMKARRAIKKC